MINITFKERNSIEQVEEAHDFAPKFDPNGLIPVVTTDYHSGELLMHGYMNEEALKKPFHWERRFTIPEVGKQSGIKERPPA